MIADIPPRDRRCVPCFGGLPRLGWWLIAATEGERFTPIPHDQRPVLFSTWPLPFHALDCCLKQAGRRLKDGPHVVSSFDPFLLLDTKRDDRAGADPLAPSRKGKEFKAAWASLVLVSIVNGPPVSWGMPRRSPVGISEAGPIRSPANERA